LVCRHERDCSGWKGADGFEATFGPAEIDVVFQRLAMGCPQLAQEPSPVSRSFCCQANYFKKFAAAHMIRQPQEKVLNHKGFIDSGPCRSPEIAVWQAAIH
jgi:hypothetical protein